ncbi:MAG TPA: alpha/beta hydrolase [Solirubrobacteraceae bacterium]|nr:alpha/beta hydrolase [Solirubrobacteraceae bacterium]
MSTANLSMGERMLLDHYLASNAANRAGVTIEARREFDQRWGDVATEPGGVDYVETQAAGVRAMWLLPAGSVERKVLLCLHGGGFVGGSMYTHRRLCAHVAKQTGVRALVLDYRQLPDHPHPAAAEDTEAGVPVAAEPGVRADRCGRGLRRRCPCAGAGDHLRAARARDGGRPVCLD